MSVFQVRQSGTGAILWTGAAASEVQALDAMAHEAGYCDHADLPDGLRRGALSVEILSFGSAPGPASSQGRVQGGRTGQVMERGGLEAKIAERLRAQN